MSGGTRGLGALLVMALVAVLAGCGRVEVNLVVAGDTVSGTVLTAVEKQAVEQFDVDPDEAFRAQREDFAVLAGVTEAPYEDGTWIGTAYTFNRVRLDELNRVSADNQDAIRIYRDEPRGIYSFTMIVDLTWLEDLEPEQAGQTPDPLDVSAAADRFTVQVAVTLPGEITEHNGERAGSTVTWRPPPRERSVLRADSYAAPDRSDGDSNLVAVVLAAGIGALVLAAAGLGTSWLVRRRQPAADPFADPFADRPHPTPTDPFRDDEPTPRL